MRRFLRILIALLAVAVLAAALLPYWFGAALTLAGKALGATYGEYSRNGYARFSVKDVRIVRPGVLVTVERAEADTPLLWFYRWAAGKPREVRAGAWSVEVRPTNERRAPDPEVGWRKLQRTLLQIGDTLHRYLPSAELGRGTVSWPGGELIAESGQWRERTLTVPRLRWRDEAFEVSAALGRESGRTALNGRSLTRPFGIELQGAGEQVQGQLLAWGQSAPLRATFGSRGWLPLRAELRANEWRIAGGDLKLPQYEALFGSATVEINDRQFAIEANVQGTPAPGQSLPVLQVVASASGDRNTVNVRRLDINTPGIEAHLTGPVDFRWADRALAAPAAFVVRAELEKLPWVTATGRVDGEVKLVSEGNNRWPTLEFAGRTNAVAVRDWKVETAVATGRLAWPVLTIGKISLVLPPSGRVEAEGAANLQTREIADLRVQGAVPYAFVAPLVPKGYRFSTAELVLKASGPFADAAHEGMLRVDELTHERLRPAAVRLWWKGRGKTSAEVEGGIQAGDTEIVAGGKWLGTSAEIQKLVWRHANEDRLALEHPATLTWQPTLAVNAFDLVGKAGELRLTATWGDAGDVRFFARGIEAEWWRNLVPKTPFDWSIHALSLQAKWDQGPVSFSTDGSFSVSLDSGETVDLQLKAAGDGRAVSIEALRAVENGKEFVTVEGKVPLAVRVRPKPSVEFGQSDELSVRGTVLPHARWWEDFGQRSGLHLQQPDLQLRLQGTWREPRGEARLSVAKIVVDEKLRPGRWPSLEEVRATLIATSGQIALQDVHVLVSGEKITAAATLPLNGEIRDKLRQSPASALRDHAEVLLKAEDVDLAAFAGLLPEQVLPQGGADVDLKLSAHAPWSGHVRLRGAGTRPLGAWGPLRQIEGDVEVRDRTLELKGLKAEFGGQPVVVAGKVELTAGDEPRFDLTAKGENLPFVRQAGLLMRGDVDLALKSPDRKAPPTISGKIVMHDGLFLADVRALVPKGGSGPQRRPPYFAVTTPPFDRWRLDVSIEGERFLRARTTLFNGVASMKFQLTGNLADPRAIGAVRVEEGKVVFPFARFALNDASVRLTVENPFDPQLAIFGTSRRYGYDLKLELTGTATTPNLTFSSSPPMTSEQVLLLVMAGQTPKNEVSYTATQRFRAIGTYFGQSLLNSLGGGSGEDRLTISSGERISRQGRETYNVEYDLDGRWSIIGEYDEFDEYNAGLRWQVLPKPEEKDARR